MDILHIPQNVKNGRQVIWVMLFYKSYMYMPHAGILQLMQIKNPCIQRFWDSLVRYAGSCHACRLISVMTQECRRKRRRRRREEGSVGHSTLPGSACLPEQHSPAVQEGTRRATKSDEESVTDTEKIKPSQNKEEIQEKRRSRTRI